MSKISSEIDEPVPHETVRKFRMNYVFKNIQKLRQTCWDLSDVVYVYNVPWRLAMFFRRDTRRLSMYLECMKYHEWHLEFQIETFRNLKFAGDGVKRRDEYTEGVFSNRDVIHVLWACPLKEIDEFLDSEGNLSVEVDVRMENVEGVKMKLRDFSDPTVSDMVLMADGQAFHVSKLFMACQSKYFKNLLLQSQNSRNSKNSRVGKMKIKMNGVNRHELQNFLELIHGESAVDEDSADGILRLASRFGTPTAIRRCEEFFMKTSRQELRAKLHVSIIYKLDRLKDYCISQIRTNEDVQEHLLKHVMIYEPTLRAELMRLSLMLSNQEEREPQGAEPVPRGRGQ